MRLLVTADDLGISPFRDRGIFDAFARGAIQQASLLVAGPTAAQAAAEAKQRGLPLGLHLDLTETPTCAATEDVASLLLPEGGKRGRFGLAEALAGGWVDLAHVRRETIAQIERFKDLTGAWPSHMDGHHHVHVLAPLVATLAEVCQQHAIRTTRIPHEPLPMAQDRVGDYYRQVSAAAKVARGVYRDRGIDSTEAFLGMGHMGEALQVERLRTALAALIAVDSVELMCHPGYASPTGDPFDQSPARESELQVLSQHPWATLQASGQLELGSFRTLQAKQFNKNTSSPHQQNTLGTIPHTLG